MGNTIPQLEVLGLSKRREWSINAHLSLLPDCIDNMTFCNASIMMCLHQDALYPQTVNQNKLFYFVFVASVIYFDTETEKINNILMNYMFVLVGFCHLNTNLNTDENKKS